MVAAIPNFRDGASSEAVTSITSTLNTSMWWTIEHYFPHFPSFSLAFLGIGKNTGQIVDYSAYVKIWRRFW